MFLILQRNINTLFDRHHTSIPKFMNHRCLHCPSASDWIKIIKASEDKTMKGFDSKSLGVNHWASWAPCPRATMGGGRFQARFPLWTIFWYHFYVSLKNAHIFSINLVPPCIYLISIIYLHFLNLRLSKFLPSWTEKFMDQGPTAICLNKKSKVPNIFVEFKSWNTYL